MNDELFSVVDQVVLVSGGSRGIGRALAEGFAERGAQVIIAGRQADTLARTAEEISQGEHPVAFRVCDVARPEDIDSLVDGVVGEFGRIDTLLNVAGVNTRMRIEDYPLEEYDRIVGINLRGAFVMAQRVGRQMIGRRSGSIINIDSYNTFAPLTGVGLYALSKNGLQMMTRAMGSEWGKHGVRVNAIAPGFFPTRMTSGILDKSLPQSEAVQALKVILAYSTLAKKNVFPHLAESRVVGPTLGQASLQKSLFAAAIGFAIVSLFMLIYYRAPGFVAIISILIFGLDNSID